MEMKTKGDKSKDGESSHAKKKSRRPKCISILFFFLVSNFLCISPIALFCAPLRLFLEFNCFFLPLTSTG